MKAFEFRLERIAQYRKQQADLARNRLQVLSAELQRLEDEIASLATLRVQARTEVTGRAGLDGGDLAALSQYQAYLARRAAELLQKKTALALAVEKQRNAVMEAERSVKLLDRLRDRKFQEWEAAAARELDNLAADSHMARLAANRTGGRYSR